MGENRQWCAIRVQSTILGGEGRCPVWSSRPSVAIGTFPVLAVGKFQSLQTNNLSCFPQIKMLRFMDSSLLGRLVHHRHSVERSSCPQHGPLPMTLGREARGCSVHSHPHASKPGSAPSSLLAHHISSTFANSPHSAVSCLRDHS